MSKKSAPEKIGAIVESVLSERGYLTVCRELGVVRAWPSICGRSAFGDDRMYEG